MTPEVKEALDEAHREGHTMVMVGVDDEARRGHRAATPSVRPEVREIVSGTARPRDQAHRDHLRRPRGADQEAGRVRWAWTATSPRSCRPTRPITWRSSRRKARKVCFVGDGINDSIALKKANVSISLRGASSIATDTAHIVFMEEGLAKLCELRDIARDLDRNVEAKLDA